MVWLERSFEEEVWEVIRQCAVIKHLDPMVILWSSFKELGIA